MFGWNKGTTNMRGTRFMKQKRAEKVQMPTTASSPTRASVSTCNPPRSGLRSRKTFPLSQLVDRSFVKEIK